MNISAFISQHAVVGGMLVSVLWFLAARQYGKEGRAGIAFLWQAIAVMVLFVSCIRAVLSNAWLSLAIAIIGLIVEVWITGRDLHKQSSGI